MNWGTGKELTLNITDSSNYVSNTEQLALKSFKRDFWFFSILREEYISKISKMTTYFLKFKNGFQIGFNMPAKKLY